MAKQSKISVKHYLEKKVKPEIKDGIERYPVFVIIIFNRMIIRRKSNIITKYTVNEFETLNDVKVLKYEINLITKIVELFCEHQAKGKLNTKFLNFSSRNSYKSQNKELNILNSYIYFYCYFIDNNVVKETTELGLKYISKKLDSIFIFNKESVFKDKLLSFFEDIVFYDVKNNDDVEFFKNNFDYKFNELVFLDYCNSKFSNYYIKLTGDNYGIPFFVWFFDNQKIKSDFKKFILKSKHISEIAVKMNIKLNENILNEFLAFIDKVVFDENYIEKHKI